MISRSFLNPRGSIPATAASVLFKLRAASDSVGIAQKIQAILVGNSQFASVHCDEGGLSEEAPSPDTL
jgi:hypothetical protein